jgi:L-lactate dehydrogenase complex protein LldF
MGSVLTPLMVGLGEAQALPNASSLCGRCESVCPMMIPLPRMLRALRERANREHHVSWIQRSALRAWGAIAHRPALYRVFASAGARAIAALGRRGGRLPGSGPWTDYRALPRPEGRTFMAEARTRLGNRLR